MINWNLCIDCDLYNSELDLTQLQILVWIESKIDCLSSVKTGLLSHKKNLLV